MRLVFAEKTTVFGFDSNDSIHSNQITQSNGDLAKPKKMSPHLHPLPNGERRTKERRLGQRRHMTAGKPSLLENCRAGASPAWATGAVALQFTRRRRIGARAAVPIANRRKKKAQRAKHTSDPIFPAPGTLLSTALPSGSLQLYLNFIAAHGTRLPRHPKIKEITNSTRNITNRSFAMPADAAAIPPNPKTAATSAMIRNTTAQPNISSPPHRLNRICRLPRASLHGVRRLDSGLTQRAAPAGNITFSGAALSAARSFLIKRVLTRPASRGATR